MSAKIPESRLVDQLGGHCPVCLSRCGFFDGPEQVCVTLAILSARQRLVDQARERRYWDAVQEAADATWSGGTPDGRLGMFLEFGAGLPEN